MDDKSKKAFLDTPEGRRLQRVEYFLELLKNGELPHLRYFVANARFEVRSAENAESIDQLLHADDAREVIRDTTPGAVVTAELLDGHVQVTLLHDKNAAESNAKLYALTAQAVGALTYAALGLDMTGLGLIPDETKG